MAVQSSKNRILSRGDLTPGPPSSRYGHGKKRVCPGMRVVPFGHCAASLRSFMPLDRGATCSVVSLLSLGGSSRSITLTGISRLVCSLRDGSVSMKETIGKRGSRSMLPAVTVAPLTVIGSCFTTFCPAQRAPKRKKKIQIFQ